MSLPCKLSPLGSSTDCPGEDRAVQSAWTERSGMFGMMAGHLNSYTNPGCYLPVSCLSTQLPTTLHSFSPPASAHSACYASVQNLQLLHYVLINTMSEMGGNLRHPCSGGDFSQVQLDLCLSDSAASKPWDGPYPSVLHGRWG